MGTSATLVDWSGTALEGHVVVSTPDGQSLTFTELGELAAHLRGRGDPWGGLVRCAAALGLVRHGLSAMQQGRGDLGSALREGGNLLSGLPVTGVVERLGRCVAAHRDLLGWRECIARLVLEAKRLRREQVEAVTVAVEAARPVIPASGPLLLAWPSGSACDLGEGLLTGAVLATRRSGEVLVAGPAALTTAAVAQLSARGLAAQAIDALPDRPLAGVLLRCVGERGMAEASAVELARAAGRRGARLVAIGVDCGGEPGNDGLAALPVGCTRIAGRP
jgi:hypothetical protein